MKPTTREEKNNPRIYAMPISLKKGTQKNRLENIVYHFVTGKVDEN